VYAGGMLLFHITVILLLNTINISPLCSQHVKLFLKLFVPAVMVSEITLLLLIIKNRDWPKKRVSNIKLLVCGLIAFGIGSCVYHIIAVLLGASVTDVVEETFMFSCLCSALTVFPLYIVHESQWEEFVDYLPENLDVRNHLPDGVKMMTYFTIVGAWIGAFPIPLDWDRDWQTWPITCCVSAIGGNIVGALVVIVMCTSQVDQISFRKWKVW